MGKGYRRRPALVAAALLVIGLLAVAVRFDTPADPGLLRLGWSTWRSDGVVVDVPAGVSDATLRSGDVISAIAGHRLTEPPGGVPRPAPGEVLSYQVNGAESGVLMRRPSASVLITDGWGNLIFVLALGALALALYRRRPKEPATGALLVGAAGLFASTVVVVAGLPALAVAIGGPLLWLFNLGTVAVYAVGWGGMVALALLMVPDHPWLRRAPCAVLGVAYAGPVAVQGLWAAGVAIAVPSTIGRLGLVHGGTTAVVAATQVVGIAAGLVAFRSTSDPALRARVRWLGLSGAVAIVLGLVGWLLPELITGRHLLPSGALGLAGLPFVVGLAVALRRHQLFDIERLVNRSLVYGLIVVILVAGYAGLVALFVTGLQLSNAVAAALAAAFVALVLAPLRGAAQRVVNRLMYGHRDDPAGVLTDLGAKLASVLLPGEVLPAAVAEIGSSLRVPFVAIDLSDGGGGFRPSATFGRPVGPVHTAALVHHGETVGLLRVSGRGRDDPLDATDLSLIGSLAQQIGPAVQAVRLHDDLVRSRAAVVASREDERRRLRRDLHDGLGPSLAAIRLKAGLAARKAPAGSATRTLLDEIGTEVQASIADIRRVVDALRPPALDELGLVGALHARASSLTGELRLTVSGPDEMPTLPAAVETAAYRIAVEAMTNAVRHSRAETGTVTVEVGSGALTVAVRDDGIGLGTDHEAGVGLRSMTERAAEVGGTCQISAPADGGTLVRARLPLDLAGTS